MRSPERAWARARVQPQTRPYAAIAVGLTASGSMEPFQSLSWRTQKWRRTPSMPCLAAHPTARPPRPRPPRFGVDGTLPVLELAPVEVAVDAIDAVRALPAPEDVAGG